MEENVSKYANYECLKIEVADKVATVTLNRPQARNAINQKLIRELRSIWDDLADDHAVNAVVLTGAGDYFSVGGDVKPAHRQSSARARQADHRRHQRRRHRPCCHACLAE